MFQCSTTTVVGSFYNPSVTYSMFPCSKTPVLSRGRTMDPDLPFPACSSVLLPVLGLLQCSSTPVRDVFQCSATIVMAVF